MTRIFEPPPAPSAVAPGSSAREKILASAYQLFSKYGTRAVGIDAIIAHSGVAKMTLYRHFASKDDLVLAFLERRERLWTQEWLQTQAAQRSHDAASRLLAIFDVFDEWFQREDFEGCSFVNVLLEHSGMPGATHDASVQYLAGVREFLRDLATEAGIADTEHFARQWHILMKGSIVSAQEGDRQAARRAREIGALVLDAARNNRVASS